VDVTKLQQIIRDEYQDVYPDYFVSQDYVTVGLLKSVELWRLSEAITKNLKLKQCLNCELYYLETEHCSFCPPDLITQVLQRRSELKKLSVKISTYCKSDNHLVLCGDKILNKHLKFYIRGRGLDCELACYHGNVTDGDKLGIKVYEIVEVGL